MLSPKKYQVLGYINVMGWRNMNRNEGWEEDTESVSQKGDRTPK